MFLGGINKIGIYIYYGAYPPIGDVFPYFSLCGSVFTRSTAALLSGDHKDIHGNTSPLVIAGEWEIVERDSNVEAVRESITENPNESNQLTLSIFLLVEPLSDKF